MSPSMPNRRPLLELFSPRTSEPQQPSAPGPERRSEPQSEAARRSSPPARVDTVVRFAQPEDGGAETVSRQHRDRGAFDGRTLSRRTGQRLARLFAARPPSSGANTEASAPMQSSRPPAPPPPELAAGASLAARDTRTLSRRSGRTLAAMLRRPDNADQFTPLLSPPEKEANAAEGAQEEQANER